jgi:hypothetical protein
MGNNEMNQKNTIIFLFESRFLEELINSFSPSEIVKSLSFINGLSLAYQLLYNKKWDENLQEFAIKLLYEIRKTYPEMWNESWEYDALLGLACNITCKYEERYEAYKRAFGKTKNPPPGLLIELARCCICPGSPPVSYDDAIDLVLKALKDAPYADGIGLLSHIYSLKDDKKNEEYWTKILTNSNQNFVSPPIEPKFLIEEYLREINEKR